MSIAAVRAVLDHSRAKRAARMVLFALAEHANDHGLCWPSVARLARECNCAESSVYRSLADLKAAGEIEVVRDAPGEVVVYRVTVPAEGHDPSQDEIPHPSQDETPPLPGPDPAPPRMRGDPSQDGTRTVIEPPMNKGSGCTRGQAIDEWNALAGEAHLAQVTWMDDERARLLDQLLEEFDLEGWRRGLAQIRASPGLQGRDPKSNFRPPFNWLIRRSNFIQILEGHYATWGNTSKSNGGGRRSEAASDPRVRAFAAAAARRATHREQ